MNTSACLRAWRPYVSRRGCHAAHASGSAGGGGVSLCRRGRGGGGAGGQREAKGRGDTRRWAKKRRVEKTQNSYKGGYRREMGKILISF
jgi:hypothetical protein